MCDQLMCVQLELAGTGARLGCVRIPDSMLLPRNSWCDLQKLVYECLKDNVLIQKCCSNSNFHMLRLYNEHNGPEITALGLFSIDSFTAWQHFKQQLLCLKQHKQQGSALTKVVAVAFYDELAFSRSVLAFSLKSSAVAANDLQSVMAAVKRDARELKYASEAMQDNYQVVYAAVERFYDALQYASPRLQACK